MQEVLVALLTTNCIPHRIIIGSYLLLALSVCGVAYYCRVLCLSCLSRLVCVVVLKHFKVKDKK
jgi:hypothetical protein